MDKRATPEKTFKEVLMLKETQGMDNEKINYGGIGKKSLENTTNTGEKKTKESSNKGKEKQDGKEGKEIKNANLGSKDKAKDKKGKRRMVETKDGF